MAGIFYLSAQSDPPVPGGVPDWVLHGVEYGVFSIVVFRAVAGGLPASVNARRAGIVMLIVVAYGISDELHQLFVPFRTADVRDVRADTIGALIGLIVCWAWNIITGSKRQIPKPNTQR
jgi:VanZ family protein